jgi:hypothetical protein
VVKKKLKKKKKKKRNRRCIGFVAFVPPSSGFLIGEYMKVVNWQDVPAR